MSSAELHSLQLPEIKRPNEAWEPYVVATEVDLGAIRFPAEVKFCLDDSGTVAMVSVGFSSKRGDLSAAMEWIKREYGTRTYLELGVADSFAKDGPAGFYTDVAFDECDFNALITWTDTASGRILAARVSILAGKPPFIETVEGKDEKLLFEISHDVLDELRWKYGMCQNRFGGR